MAKEETYGQAAHIQIHDPKNYSKIVITHRLPPMVIGRHSSINYINTEHNVKSICRSIVVQRIERKTRSGKMLVQIR